MDPGNGRNGRVEEKSTPSIPLVFTLPYSHEEILLLTDEAGNGMGIVYNPHKMASPVPWKADCLHCLRGQQDGLNIALKRAVTVIASRKLISDIEEYKVPTNGDPCVVWCKRDDSGLIVKILQPDEEPVDAIWQGTKFITQSRSLILESKIIGRALKLIGSVRKSSRREAKACLKPLLEKQRSEGIATHRKIPCLKIDWAALLTT
jgi:hypothetical protein